METNLKKINQIIQSQRISFIHKFMSQSFQQSVYTFPNAYERSAAASEWVLREQGGFDAPPPPPPFDAGGMLTEIINRRHGDQIQKQQLDNEVSVDKFFTIISCN